MKENKKWHRQKKFAPSGRKVVPQKRGKIGEEENKRRLKWGRHDTFPVKVSGKMAEEKKLSASSLSESLFSYLKEKGIKDKGARGCANYLISENDSINWAHVFRLRREIPEEFSLFLEFLASKKILYINASKGLYGVLNQHNLPIRLSVDEKYYCVFGKKEDASGYLKVLRETLNRPICLGRYGSNGWMEEPEEAENVKLELAIQSSGFADKNPKSGKCIIKSSVDWPHLLPVLMGGSESQKNRELDVLGKSGVIVPLNLGIPSTTFKALVPTAKGELGCLRHNGNDVVFTTQEYAQGFVAAYEVITGGVAEIDKISVTRIS